MRGDKLQVTGYKIISGVLIVLLLGGCAGMKEACRGVAGISTKVLEEHVSEAIAKEFTFDLATCKLKVRQALVAAGAYIYAEDAQKQLVAVYVSESDTTPVGLFFKEKEKSRTQVLFSSPSSYARELIAERVEKALTAQ